MPGRVRGSTPQPPSTTRPMIVIRSTIALAADADESVGDVAEIAARAGGLGAVERVAAARVGAHLENIGQDGLPAGRNRGQREASARDRRRKPDPAP